ncbi:homoserine dehydrogenase [Sedimentibacter acidaminivorans]|uniref:Homoserine dehydrogenase n=1 Tax=Sedimentibacter acidaminivorans TaxID=913099 RepID=A0ABS4GI72_9FIRM|nr:homoserine dehydrogenase [Sedimentibacter acidaminivorans]MBP1927403.1 homoserine dehydrogenase [Sedimentibacter acidaminivorans]
MKIGILGFGTVGSGVYEIISNSGNCLMKNLEISKILIRDKNKITLDNMTIEPNELLCDDNIDVIVEVMGGIHPAYEYIMKALKSGKHVVSANKAVVSKYLEEFTQTAKEHNVGFLYEASVGGGIPWLKSIKQVKRIDEISQVYGIFNGTSNFILYNMFEKGYDFNEILKLAQDKGYAESDPSADIDGIDIQRKLTIISSLAFDTVIKEESIPTFGIRHVTKSDINYFKKQNITLKLVATSVKNNNDYCSCVEPVLFTNNTIEANVSENFNIGSLTGSSIGELKFYGQGAGKLPTGNAIVQDIIDIYTEGYQNYPYYFDKKLSLNQNLIKGKYFIRFSNEQSKEVLKDVANDYFKLDSSHAIITNELTIKESQSLFEKLSKSETNLFYARYN